MTIALGATQFFRRHGIAFAVLLILTIYGCEAHARRQLLATPATLGDQGAYLAFARHMYESNYAFAGDRNRMPVFPFLLSLIYQPDLSETQFLRRAQAFNVNLSIALLLLLFLIFRRFFPPLHAVALLAASAFGVFLYRAVNAQTELLFYFISFCAFVQLLRMLIHPRWWLAVSSGATVGVAHLTKASEPPALVLWVAVFLAQISWGFCAEGVHGLGKAWRRLGMLLLVVATFIAVLFPYLQTNKRIYGQYFYNENSNFVMWCDSWTEGLEFLTAYRDKANWRELVPSQVPSPAKYWREHSAGQIAHRLLHGLRRLITRNVMAIGHYKFVVASVLAGGFLWLRQRERARRLLAEKPFAAIFCGLFFPMYLLLYAWYDAIVTDTRFVLAIFLPFIFVVSIFVLHLGKDRFVAIAGRPVPWVQFFPGLMIGLAAIDALYNAVSCWL